MYSEIAGKIQEEQTRQKEKFGNQCGHTPLLWLAILTEEVGELAKDIIEGKNYEEELVQVAAVAASWLDCKYKREI